MKRFFRHSFFLTLLLCISQFSHAKTEYLSDYTKMIEGSHYFTPNEKAFARQLLKGASRDDSILDAIMESPLVSDKQKQVAKKYFDRKNPPKKVKFKQKPYDKDLEVVTPPLKIQGNLDFRLRSIDTARDVGNVFALDNADYDQGFAQIIKGKLHYRPRGVENPKVFGWLDVDVQGADGETEVLNGHFQNGVNYLELGTFLSPTLSEFGMKNTEYSGVRLHLKHQKWILDFVRGDTAEDYVPALDQLSVGGGVIRRELNSSGKDWLGLSAYDSRGNHYLGLLGEGYFLNDSLRLYTELMHRDSGLVGRNGLAREFEVDYESRKILFLNEIQKVSSRFASTLNPEYSNFSNNLNELDNHEHSFTYRFDPYITSSVVYASRRITPVGAPAVIETQDSTLALMTHRPDRPKYMFVLKGIDRQDNLLASINEKQLIAMGRTTFKARDIITNIDVRLTNFDDEIVTTNSFILNTVSIEVERPFLNKVWVKERLSFLDQNFKNSLNDSESQFHHFELQYRADHKTTFKGVQKYRRVARKSRSNKYKMMYGFEAHHKMDENLSYKLRLDSYNNNEFTKGYDANLVSIGADLKF